MTDIDLSVDAIGKLSPTQLVELLARLDPHAGTLQQIDVDAIGRAIDPTKLRPGEFRTLLEHVDRLASSGGAVDLSRLGAQTFATLIGRAAKEQLREVLSRPRLRIRILDEIFRRMRAHLREEQAASVDAVVHWRFPDGVDDHDRYETVISHGECLTGRDRTRDPRVTITVGAYDFLRLITSHTSPRCCS